VNARHGPRLHCGPYKSRANFTDRDIDPRQPHQHLVGENSNFCRSALSRYAPADFIALVQKHRIPFHEKHKGQLFCWPPGHRPHRHAAGRMRDRWRGALRSPAACKPCVSSTKTG